jgi:uncharacterized protein (TIGR00369 family)
MTDLKLPEGGVRLDGRPHGGGFTGHLGLVLTRVESGEVHAWAEVGPVHHQDMGIVHGGWYAAVVETVASFGAHTAATVNGMSVVGVANTTEFFRPVRTGRLDVVAAAVHQGRTQQVWEVHITRADDGKLVARGQLRLQNVNRRRADATDGEVTSAG